jgi:hypothetical protein
MVFSHCSFKVKDASVAWNNIVWLWNKVNRTGCLRRMYAIGRIYDEDWNNWTNGWNGGITDCHSPTELQAIVFGNDVNRSWRFFVINKQWFRRSALPTIHFC